jgi:hypothetical protein
VRQNQDAIEMPGEDRDLGFEKRLDPNPERVLGREQHEVPHGAIVPGRDLPLCVSTI